MPTAHFSDANFPNSVQTQVVGINNLITTATVGFYIDSDGNNFGFYNKNGNFMSIANPKAGIANGITTNQLLGINDNAEMVGFYNDAAGNSHGYIFNVKTQAFTNLKLPFKATSFQATGINDAGVICSFYTVGKTMRGFIGTPGHFASVAPIGAASFALLGVNNTGQAAGVSTDRAGVSHGAVYDVQSQDFTVVDPPDASSQAAFGVTGTTVNGINDAGALVGFFSDGTNVNGFLALPTTPTSGSEVGN